MTDGYGPTVQDWEEDWDRNHDCDDDEREITYESHAKWSSGIETSDNHRDESAAMSVCNLLTEGYGPHTPCPTRGVCLESWWTEK